MPPPDSPASEPDLTIPPPGFRLEQDRDGRIVVLLPAAQDRVLSYFFLFFAAIFLGVGGMLLSKGQNGGTLLLGFGLLILWPGAYWLTGKVELVLGPEGAEWTRIFLKRWSTHNLPREAVVAIGSTVSVRTNGRPSSWGLYFLTRDKKPLPRWMQDKFPVTNHAFHDRSRQRRIAGSWNEAGTLWLGHLLQRWSGQPFDTGLDHTVDNSSD